LADKFRSNVRAVDFSREFLDELIHRAKQHGLEDLVEAIECDMGHLDWKPESIDLLWSEGAAYNLTFKGALDAWRPLMAPNGMAVISELNYFTNEVSEPLRAYWQNAYPTIGTEAENSKYAEASGFKLLGIYRLPAKAWWDNYYDPLREKMNLFRDSTETIMQSVIKDTEEEMNLFEKYGDQYGYSFYIMEAVS
jgi:hypothetical protein